MYVGSNMLLIVVKSKHFSGYFRGANAGLMAFEYSRPLISMMIEKVALEWSQELLPISPCILPDHSKDKCSTQVRDESIDRNIHRLTNILEAYAAANGTTVSVFLKAAWALALSYYVNKQQSFGCF